MLSARTCDGEAGNAVSSQGFLSGRGGQPSCKKKTGFNVIQTILEHKSPRLPISLPTAAGAPAF
jgi:hypothetical protein